jgi:NADPH-dependent curcumin reductase CurA
MSAQDDEQSDDTPTQVRLSKLPSGVPDESTWRFTHDPTPEPADGEVTLRIEWLSIDPAMVGWITPKKSYIEAVPEGEVMRAFGLGRVVASRSPRLSVGDYAFGFTGVQTEATMNAMMLRPIDPSIAPLEKQMGGLGMTGFTAYFGLLDLGQPKEGETVVVSAAAGAVGSVAVQVAKIHGCRVVGVAGGPEKCAYVKDELGADVVVDYKNDNVPEALATATPKGVDVYFDNVGGEVLDVTLMLLNRHARIVLCGAVSQYTNPGGVMQGPSNYLQITTQSAKLFGFTMRDYLHRVPEALQDLSKWMDEGRLTTREHILEGIECFPSAVKMIFAGENRGKLLIRI